MIFFIVRIQYIIHTTYKICVILLFMLLGRLLVNSTLLVQLALYICRFPTSDRKYCFQSTVAWICGCQTCGYEGQSVVRFGGGQKLYVDFQLHRGGIPHPHVVQRSTVQHPGSFSNMELHRPCLCLRPSEANIVGVWAQESVVLCKFPLVNLMPLVRRPALKCLSAEWWQQCRPYLAYRWVLF